MQIVEHDQHRPGAGEVLEQVGDRVEQAKARLFGVKLRGRVDRASSMPA
jgi:hypothetical protein